MNRDAYNPDAFRDFVLGFTCDHFGVAREDVRGLTYRKPDVLLARLMTFRLLIEYELGRKSQILQFLGRHPDNAFRLESAFEEYVEANPRRLEEYQSLRGEISERMRTLQSKKGEG